MTSRHRFAALRITSASRTTFRNFACPGTLLMDPDAHSFPCCLDEGHQAISAYRTDGILRKIRWTEELPNAYRCLRISVENDSLAIFNLSYSLSNQQHCFRRSKGTINTCFLASIRSDMHLSPVLCRAIARILPRRIPSSDILRFSVPAFFLVFPTDAPTVQVSIHNCLPVTILMYLV